MSFTNPGGRLARQDSVDTIIRDLQKRVRALEQSLASVVTGQTTTFQAPTTYTLVSPAMSWTISHNKDRFVLVKMYDSTGQEIEVDVSCPDMNTVRLSADEPFSGTAVVG